MSDLGSRATKMLRTQEPIRLVGVNRSIHFLRGVFSRSSMCLPAFYYFLGSASAHEEAKKTEDYPFKIAQTYSEYANLSVLSLACRKIFDHAAKPDLTGGNFGKLPNSVLEDHAAYWVTLSGRHFDDCRNALIFLRLFFAEYSKTDTVLLQANGDLQKRIGLLKQHGDRAAAHLSLQDYSLDILDLVHVTAAVVIVADIIRSFDCPHVSNGYFNDVDAASYQAAQKIFPQIAAFQIFKNMKVHQQARFYWNNHSHLSITSCFDQLQLALG